MSAHTDGQRGASLLACYNSESTLRCVPLYGAIQPPVDVTAIYRLEQWLRASMPTQAIEKPRSPVHLDRSAEDVEPDQMRGDIRAVLPDPSGRSENPPPHPLGHPKARA